MGQTERLQEPKLSRQEQKLIRYYLSGGDNGFIYDAGKPGFGVAEVGDAEKELVIDKMRWDSDGYREIESQLLNSMARSPYYDSDEKIFDGVNGDLHQKRILAYMTGVDWQDFNSVSAKNMGEFLDKYPTPLEFEEDADSFLNMIGEANGVAKYNQYVDSMDRFCHQVYGKKYEYYKIMRSLHEEAESRRMTEETTRKGHQRLGERVLGFNSWGEKYEKERLIADAGAACLNKGNLVGRPERRNEDAMYYNLQDGIFGVFDGAGGMYGGERAANLAVAVVKNMVGTKKPERAEDLAKILQTASDTLYYDPAAGNATSVMGRVIEKNGDKSLIYASIGDSRIYLVRNEIATQITRDEGYGNVVYNALGAEDASVSQIGVLDLKKGDRLVFCSDGITGDYEKDFIPDAEFGVIVGRAKSAKQAADALAKRATKIDDRTAVVVEV